MRILASADARDEIQQLVVLAFECLAMERKYPIPAQLLEQQLCEPEDIANAQRAATVIVTGSNLIYKRAFILYTLCHCPTFVREMCPAPSEGALPTRARRFLANGDLMQQFVGTRGQRTPSPLQCQTARLLSSNINLAKYNATCYRIWTSGLSARPWHRAQEWQAADIFAVGRELSARVLIERQGAGSALHDPDQQYLLEHSAQGGDAQDAAMQLED